MLNKAAPFTMRERTLLPLLVCNRIRKGPNTPRNAVNVGA